MVRLHSTLGDDGRRIFLQCVRHQKFEFSRLVAAGSKPGAIVPFDVDVGTAKMARQARQEFQRRG
jgi:hypothetical protein